MLCCVSPRPYLFLFHSSYGSHVATWNGMGRHRGARWSECYWKAPIRLSNEAPWERKRRAYAMNFDEGFLRNFRVVTLANCLRMRIIQIVSD